jgi:hypothetical protein
LYGLHEDLPCEILRSLTVADPPIHIPVYGVQMGAVCLGQSLLPINRRNGLLTP